MIECDQIIEESEKLKALFNKCYSLKASDMRRVVDLIESSYLCSSGSTSDSPFELITDGFDSGIVIRGRIASNYGSVGNRAIDFSFSDIENIPPFGATGTNSYAEGKYVIASGQNSHAEGESTEAIGKSSHAEGNITQATGLYSHSEGSSTQANEEASHSEGIYTQANGKYSHAQGYASSAYGEASHAEGGNSQANGKYSHAGGDSNFANSYSETSIGYFGTDVAGDINLPVPTDRLFNIGNGSLGTKSDAFTLLKNGLATLPSVTNSLISLASSKAVVTKEYLVSVIPVIDGSETKLTQGSNITITGNGTASTPYNISSSVVIDGSETKLQNGDTTTVSGNGTIATPYKVDTVNLQRNETNSFSLQAPDNNYSIKINNGSTPITITVPTGLPSNFFVGITQKGTGDVTISPSGTTLNNPVGLKIKGQGYFIGIEQLSNSGTFDILGNTKA